MKVYIAGKISGDPNYREKFRVAQEELERKRYIVLNPAVLPAGMSKADYMAICIPMLQLADMIVMLPGWEDSPGARLELEYARYVGKKVMEITLKHEVPSGGWVMSNEEAATVLTMHLMQLGQLMPEEWLRQNGEGSEFMEAYSIALDALRGGSREEV